MKPTEEYLDDYLDKYNELEKKNELWRLRVTPQEFLEEIERIRAYGIEARKGNYLTEYHIQSNEKNMISVLLMGGMTKEEMIEQGKRFNEVSKEAFAKEAPEIQSRLRFIQTPLKFFDIVSIYLWLWRKQIKIEMLPEAVLDEFKKNSQYETILRRDESESSANKSI